MEETLVVGIDPGFSGGMAALTLAGTVRATARMPVLQTRRSELDGASVIRFLRDLPGRYVGLVCLEQVSPMPGEGVSGAFNFGHAAGRLRGIVEALELPHQLVTPQEWRRVVLKAIGKRPEGARLSPAEVKKQLKAASIAYCQRRWPAADLRGSMHASAKAHDGIADALCLAEYARLVLVGNVAQAASP